jgi:5-(carboxyamino)imidazole ribonucleotide synthase
MLEDLKIGILGGGQLGAMIIRHAIDFGLDVSVMDKDKDAPCSRYTSSFTAADPMNYDAVIKFGEHLHILTIEREAVNTSALRALQQKGVKVFPSPDTIDIIKNKYVQKKFLMASGVAVVPGVAVSSKEDIRNNLHRFPCCLKKCTDGYDGYGVMILRNEDDIEKAFEGDCLLEDMADIKHEISVIVSRNENGQIECYNPILMMFDNDKMLLDFQLCPANIERTTAIEACNIAIQVAKALNLVGIMAVEMFLTNDGKLLVNELAPRPHNSGHHTIEASVTSQYEQQLRAILGLPLGDTSITYPSVMINILEPAIHRKKSLENALKTILCTDSVHLHWYGKKGGKEGRKMGHITVTDKNIEDALSKATMIRHLLKEQI